MKTTSLPVAPNPCSTVNSTHCCSGLLKDRPTPTSQHGWRRGPGQTLCSNYIFLRQAAYWHFGLFLIHEREFWLSGAGLSSEQRRSCPISIIQSLCLCLSRIYAHSTFHSLQKVLCVSVCVCMYMSVSLDREYLSISPSSPLSGLFLFSC